MAADDFAVIYLAFASFVHMDKPTYFSKDRDDPKCAQLF